MACEGLGTRLNNIEAALGEALIHCTQNYVFSLTTAQTTPTTIYNLPMPDLQIAIIEFKVGCRQQDGLGRSSFLRNGLFYRESSLSSSVQIQRFWHTLVTTRSNPAFQVSYHLNADSIDFLVQAADPGPTDWEGCLAIKLIG